uniref:spermatogenesis-associated serine-rich protein 1 n=1 Tax=Euleptes europaea TaxID=460621 RepID=UPI002540C3E8|nr:spermatogenesis-associated serine-rich protein 1 [Euleptes europaea]
MEEIQTALQGRRSHRDKEWTFYPSYANHTYHNGKKCIFDGIYLRNKTCTSERTLETRIGKKKYEIDSRNGLPLVTPGDHPYACPEQSRDFHKMGSTMPPVNFGSVPFRIKERQQELEREKQEVKNLEFWKPAPSLMQTLFVRLYKAYRLGSLKPLAPSSGLPANWGGTRSLPPGVPRDAEFPRRRRPKFDVGRRLSQWVRRSLPLCAATVPPARPRSHEPNPAT